MAFLDRLQTLGKKLKESKLPQLAGIVLGETSIGKVGRIIKGAAEILGTDEDPDAIAEALAGATPEQRAALLELSVRETEAVEETEREIQRQTTARHAADMMGDSLLSKNLRPVLCIALNAAAVAYSYTILIVVILGQILEVNLNVGDYSRGLIANALTALWTAAGAANVFYFGGRTLEKRGSFFAAASRD